MAALSRELLHAMPLPYTQLLLLVGLAWVAFVYITRYKKYRKVRQLGLTAPVMKAYLPLNLDLPVRACMYFLRNRAMDAWLDEWKKLGALQTLNYTMELRMLVDMRVVLTADPENIKAMLTQQFSDYGKGEWSMCAIPQHDNHELQFDCSGLLPIIVQPSLTSAQTNLHLRPSIPR